MSNDDYTNSNNWNVWAKHVLSELERLDFVEKKFVENLANIDSKHIEQVLQLIERVAKLEAKVSSHTKILSIIGTTACTAFFGMILLILRVFLVR